ncbi:MAG: sulfurtransferase [Streptosporangiales bacterium]|nr:sulfurtransferase [Streptosporangiales bacterium]
MWGGGWDSGWVPADARSPLIDVDTLAADLAGPNPPVLLDVRWSLGGPPGLSAYREGHLPEAVYVDLDHDLAGPHGPGEPVDASRPGGAAGRHPMPLAEDFERAMRAAGVREDAPVVCYDEAAGTAAARAWWLLRYFRHPDVRVLDGGFRAWAAAGRPVSTDEPRPVPGDCTARPGGMPLLDADGAARLAAEGVLLDARSGERYRGENEPVDPVAGHIPGAVSAPTTDLLGPDGRLLPPDRLRTTFTGLGIAPDRPTGAYCGSGVTAAHEVLALAVAGVDAALYVGSWSDWITDPTRPIATGPS